MDNMIWALTSLLLGAHAKSLKTDKDPESLIKDFGLTLFYLTQTSLGLRVFPCGELPRSSVPAGCRAHPRAARPWTRRQCVICDAVLALGMWRSNPSQCLRIFQAPDWTGSHHGKVCSIFVTIGVVLVVLIEK